MEIIIINQFFGINKFIYFLLIKLIRKIPYKLGIDYLFLFFLIYYNIIFVGSYLIINILISTYIASLKK